MMTYDEPTLDLEQADTADLKEGPSRPPGGYAMRRGKPEDREEPSQEDRSW